MGLREGFISWWGGPLIEDISTFHETSRWRGLLDQVVGDEAGTVVEGGSGDGGNGQVVGRWPPGRRGEDRDVANMTLLPLVRGRRIGV